jgi:hypothetical protein
MWAKPSDTYLDSPFLDTGLRAYYDALGEDAERGALHESYADIKLPGKRFLKFAEAVGVQVRLEIELVSCSGNRAASDLIWTAPGRWSNNGINADYTVEGLESLIKKKNEALSRLVWKTVCDRRDTDWLRAQYRNSLSHTTKKTFLDSSSVR